MTRRILLVAAVAALLAALLPASPASAASTRSGAPHGLRAAAIVPNGSWTTYHHDDARTGYDASASTATSVAVTPGWTLPVLDGQVYAEPLIYNGVVYAATLNDTVYALNQIDGSVIWSKHVGTPQTTGWGCGNVSPTGILGTPVIDTSANRLYAVAEVVITGNTSYHMYGLDLANSGNVVLDTPIVPNGFDWTIEQERGALGLRGGIVYVPFGGRAGDCGNYHGWVVAVPTSGAAIAHWFVTPGQGMGIWAAGGVAIDDSTGKVFASTGNGTGSGCNSPDGGVHPTFENDAVVRLTPGTLVHEDFFMPPDWQGNWCSNDQDLGSIAPILLSSSLIFQTGKWGTGFLLNPNSLGGLDGQLYPTPSPAAYVEADTCLGNNSDATFGSAAYAAPFIYVECDGHGLVALNVNTGAPSFSPCSTCAAPDWHAGGTSTFGPPIIAGGAVWVASNGGGLFAFNATTGAQIFHSTGFGINRFVTPAEAGNQVFVPSGNVIRSFTFAAGITFTPTQLNFGGQAPTTTSSGQTVTLHNNTASTVNVSAVAVTGANMADYAKGTDTCSGAAVTTGSTCTVTVTFTPPGFGGLPASLTFTDDGPASPQSVQLNGTGALDDHGHLYTLDGYGGLHADGGAPVLSSTTYWPNFNIARSLALFPDGTGGYILDGYGGLHPVGSAPAATGGPYWPGFDIARQVAMAPWSTAGTPAGWVLDGYGGVHPFGGAPAVSGNSYWGGWDIARGLAILPDSTPGGVAGYTLDGWGGVHRFGGAPVIGNAPYWPNWDIARGLTLSPDANIGNGAGWVVDGYGGLHPFGTAPTLAGSAYFGRDLARGIVAWTGAGAAQGGWVMDGWGGMHAFGAAAAIVGYPYWPNFDIATSLGANGESTGSRRRT